MMSPRSILSQSTQSFRRNDADTLPSLEKKRIIILEAIAITLIKIFSFSEGEQAEVTHITNSKELRTRTVPIIPLNIFPHLDMLERLKMKAEYKLNAIHVTTNVHVEDDSFV